jgi:DNA-directed RNA polymerase subunit F
MSIAVGIVTAKTLSNMRESIEHELEHFAQWLIGNDFGKPPRKLRDRSVDQNVTFRGLDKSETHSLDDIEFYPSLMSEVEWFRRRGEGDIERYVRDSKFFGHLKKHNRAKWQKAVKEFVKMVRTNKQAAIALVEVAKELTAASDVDILISDVKSQLDSTWEQIEEARDSANEALENLEKLARIAKDLDDEDALDQAEALIAIVKDMEKVISEAQSAAAMCNSNAEDL